MRAIEIIQAGRASLFLVKVARWTQRGDFLISRRWVGGVTIRQCPMSPNTAFGLSLAHFLQPCSDSQIGLDWVPLPACPAVRFYE